MIHISLDQSSDAALKWAESFKQPWPIMLQEDTDQKKLVEPYKVRGVPAYILVDRNGKEVARGKAAALAAAKKDEA